MVRHKKSGQNIKFICLIIICAFVFMGCTKNTADIYKEAFTGVVELKCYTKDVGESYGSAVLVNSEGYMLTNAHIVTFTQMGENQLFELIEVRFADEEEFRPAEIIKYDIEKDIAVLRLSNIEDRKLKPIKIGNDLKVQSGDTVYAVGNSANFGIGITKGIVSIPSVNIHYEEVNRNVIQCDITIASGNSGGALLNSKGELIGITTFRIKDNNGNIIQGFAYSIPIRIISEFYKI